MMPIWESVDFERREACFNDVLQRRKAEEDWSVDENRTMSDWVNLIRNSSTEALQHHKDGARDLEYTAWADIAATALARLEILQREAAGDIVFVFEIPDEAYRQNKD